MIAVFTIVLLGLLGIIIWFTGKKVILEPITSLEKTAQQLKSGNLDTEINTHRPDEIGNLARSFAEMRNAINKKIADLHLAKSYTNNIISSMSDTLMVLSRNGHIETVNMAMCGILGYTEKELVGQHFGIVIGMQETVHEANLAKLIKKDSIATMDVMYRAKNR